MAIVVAVKSNPNKPETGFVKFKDGSEAWTPELKLVEEWVGREIPNGWTIREGPKGKQLLPPKKPGGGGYRNTKEAFEAEQTSIHRSVALEWACRTYGAEWEPMVRPMFAWLEGAPRQPSQAAEPAGERSSSAAARVPPPASSSAQNITGETTEDEGRAGSGQVGADPDTSASACPHLQLDPLKPDGRKYPRGYARCTQCGDVLKVTA